jgi:transcriptional regulator with XRE-family HTH domain
MTIHPRYTLCQPLLASKNGRMSERGDFGKWMAAQRKRRGISQERLGKITGIDRGHLSKIENGKIELPGYETRQRIHAALGTSENDLKALGIIRDAHGYVRTGSATASGGTHTAIAGNQGTIGAVESATIAKQFFASFSPAQQEMLMAWIELGEYGAYLKDVQEEAKEEGEREREEN